MSWPVTMYYCTVCNFEQGDGGTRGTREYVLDNGVRIPVRWQIGWCESCNGLAAIEDLSIHGRIQDYRGAQRDLQFEIKRSRLSWLFGLSKSEKSLRRMYEDCIEDAFDALEMLANRKSQPHCLTCLSTEVHLPEKPESANEDTPNSPCIFNSIGQGAEESDLQQDRYSNQSILLHPGCGGEIRPRKFDQDDNRIDIKQSVHRYTPEGLLIEKEYIAGCATLDRKYYDDLSESNRRCRAFPLKKSAEGGLHFLSFLRKFAD